MSALVIAHSSAVAAAAAPSFDAPSFDPITLDIARDTGIAPATVELARTIAGARAAMNGGKRALTTAQHAVTLNVIAAHGDSARDKVKALFSHASVTGWSAATAAVMHDTARRLLTKWGYSHSDLYSLTVTADKPTSFSTLERKAKALNPGDDAPATAPGSAGSDDTDDAGSAPSTATGSNAELLNTLDRILTVLTDRDMSDDELNRLAMAADRARRLADCEL